MFLAHLNPIWIQLKLDLKFKRAHTTSLHTSLWLQIPYTYSLPTTHIYSTSSRRCIWNHLQTSGAELFCRNSQRVRAVGYFRRRAPFVDVWQDVSQNSKYDPANNSLWLKKGLRRSLPPLGLNILDFSCLLILLIYTNNKNSTTR